MLEILKSIGNGTLHEYDHDQIMNDTLPPRNTSMVTLKKPPERHRINNIWYDKMGIRYSLINNTLFIEADEFFPESIIAYINSIPNYFNLNIVIKINNLPNETAGFNMLCDILSRVPSNKNIFIDVSEMKIGIGVALDIEKLPRNVKISNCINRKTGEEEIPFYGENSFEWWALHCDEDNFKILLSKLTPGVKNRIHELRSIAYNFYQFAPDSIKNSSNRAKCEFAYKWCCENIEYDFEGTMPDGTFNYARPDTQDPIETFYKKKGVCAGRARLLKVLLNNYYMKTPVFLVSGMAGRLQHEWNELIDDNGESIFYDISKKQNLSNAHHFDYLLSKPFLKNSRGSR